MKLLISFLILLAAGANQFLASAESSEPSLRPAGVAEKTGYQPGDSVVTIPAWVRALPDFCFAGIEGLRRVEFEEGSRCVSIGGHAFAECPDLREIALPAGLKQLGEGCFRECCSLESLAIPEGVWVIPKEMALRCVSLREATIPPTVSDIKDSAFNGCVALRDIPLPAALRHIGANAFSDCASLQEVEVPDGVSQLESYAFSGCSHLRRAKLPDSFEALGELIFSGCTSLGEIIAPAAAPPSFECESFLFDPDDEAAYGRCTLRVPARSEASYRRSHGWDLFRNIKQ